MFQDGANNKTMCVVASPDSEWEFIVFKTREILITISQKYFSELMSNISTPTNHVTVYIKPELDPKDKLML